MPKRTSKIEFETALESAPEMSGWHYISVSGEIGEQIDKNGGSRRVVCTLNGREKFQCALMPTRGEFYILVNKKIRTSLGAVAGDVLKVSLEKDESKYGMPMPEELEEVIRQDPDGGKMFHALTAGRQRSLIYLVSSAKSEDLRIHRSLIVIQHLKDNGGKIDGERLQREMKRPLL